MMGATTPDSTPFRAWSPSMSARLIAKSLARRQRCCSRRSRTSRRLWNITGGLIRRRHVQRSRGGGQWSLVLMVRHRMPDVFAPSKIAGRRFPWTSGAVGALPGRGAGQAEEREGFVDVIIEVRSAALRAKTRGPKTPEQTRVA